MSKVLPLFILLIAVICAVLTIQYFKITGKHLRSTPPMGMETAQNVANLKLQEWHEFTAPSGQFKVLLPALPQHAADVFNDPKTKKMHKYNMYFSKKENGSIFMISLITFLDQTSQKNDKQLLIDVVQNMLVIDSTKKVVSMKDGKYLDYQSLDFSIENGTAKLNGRAFFIDNTLFILSSVSEIENYSNTEFEFFINSFRLVQKKEELKV